MDKSRMTFTFRPPRKDATAPPRDKQERFTVPQSGRFDRLVSWRGRKQNRTRYQTRGYVPPAGLYWLVPALLAAVTGLTLGLGVLFVFKNATLESGPTVTKVNPNPASGTSVVPVQTLPGLQVVAYQVGAYDNGERAKKGAAEFEKFGLYPVLRNADKVQLLIGVAPDKTQGQAVADAFRQALDAGSDVAKPPFYIRDYKVEPRTGSIQGVAAQDAAQLAVVLTQLSQMMKDGVSLAVSAVPQKETVDSWNNRIETLRPQVESVRRILDRAGRKGERARFDDIFQRLQETAAAIKQNKGILEVQRHLVQSIVDYEELIGKLVPVPN